MGPTQEDSAATYLNENAAITLPPSLFKQVNDSSISIFFDFYETAVLFPINERSSSPSSSTTRQTQVISPVISATVVTSSGFQDLRDDENITAAFRLPNNTGLVCRVLANYIIE